MSSLGHSVLLPALFHWRYRPSDPSFVPFLTLLHLGTAGALLIVYRREWVAIVVGFVRAALRGRIEGPDERIALLLAVGTIPAGLVGFLAEKPVKALFASPRAAAVFLAINGLMLLGAEMLRRRDERRAPATEQGRELLEKRYADVGALSFRAAALVGVAQAFALLPGISRSGVTMAGGLLAGLRHREAAHFSFLLATPVIGAAGVLEVPQLFTGGIPLLTYLGAALLAGIAAYASARFLLRYFRTGRLDPYGYYCVAAGVVAFGLLTLLG